MIEVPISAVRDKFELSRAAAALVVGVPAALLSVVLLGTTTGLYVLDIVDHFINQFGILAVALVSMTALAWVFRRTSVLQEHLNEFGSVQLGAGWRWLVGAITPLVLTVLLVQQFIADLREPYEGYPTGLLVGAGWAVCLAVLLVSVPLSLLPWRADTDLGDPSAAPPPTAPETAERRP